MTTCIMQQKRDCIAAESCMQQWNCVCVCVCKCV